VKPPATAQYLDHALPLIPDLLQLLDRDPLSPTAGCFDRQYWHYRTMDFPSGMSQECVLPLALVFRHPLPDNPYFEQERVREWVLAGIHFARRSGHRDGSCDDYYPFERALGAAAYSLNAMAQAYRVIDANDPDLEEFLSLRADWIMRHDESGVLANHHAIAASALQFTAEITGDQRFADGARKKAEETLSHQHEEGWFSEYGGFDPGYQTVTVDFLARYWKASGDDSLLDPLRRAVELLELTQHPDGTMGGEYGSRNTYHTQPHGLELLAPQIPAARRVADRFLGALAAGRRVRNDDDRLRAHHIYPYLLAWLDQAPRDEPTTAPQPPPQRKYLSGCGFLIDRCAERFLIAGASKGGPFRIYDRNELIANDSGVAAVLNDDQVLVSHLGLRATVTDEDGVLTTVQPLSAARHEVMTPLKSILLRIVMLGFGRWFRNTIRRLLQRRLIKPAKAAPITLTRQIDRTEDGFRVTDDISRGASGPRVKSLRLGVGQTSSYTAVSQPWDPAWLLPWVDLDDEVEKLNKDGHIQVTRQF